MAEQLQQVSQRNQLIRYGRRPRVGRLGGAMLVTTLLVSGCGSSHDQPKTAASAASETPSPTPAPAETSQPATLLPTTEAPSLSPTTTPSTTEAPPTAITGITETEVYARARTVKNYLDASGRGPDIFLGQTITVSCVALGPISAAPSAHGNTNDMAVWYLIEQPLDDAGYYTAANTFSNGDPAGVYKTAVDPAVPACPTAN